MFSKKQLISASQNTNILTLHLSLSTKTNFYHNLNDSVGIGKYSLNFSNVNPPLMIKNLNKNSINLVFSSSISNISKLNSLGFIFSNVYVSNGQHKYPFNKDLKQHLIYNSIKHNFVNVSKFILFLIIHIIRSIRNLVKHTVLLNTLRTLI